MMFNGSPNVDYPDQSRYFSYIQHAVCVDEIHDDGSASHDGRLRRGDQILSVSNTKLFRTPFKVHRLSRRNGKVNALSVYIV